MPQPPKTLNEFSSLVQAVSDLRGPQGCPWDKEQTHHSLALYALEETCEMIEALESGDDIEFCDELGDVLFQVVIHAQLAKERGAFDIEKVITAITSKLVRRHPHVFSDVAVNGTQDVLKNWEEIKKQEKLLKNKKSQDGVFHTPAHLPALQTAAKIGEKTRKFAFDWKKATEVLSQLKHEIAELEEVMATSLDNEPALGAEEVQSQLNHELGDVLFSAAQLARHLKVDPEQSLRAANKRFISRFEKMLEIDQLSLEEFTSLPLDEKEQLWSKAKKALAGRS